MKQINVQVCRNGYAATYERLCDTETTVFVSLDGLVAFLRKNLEEPIAGQSPAKWFRTDVE